jgi:Ca-activated chloride channel family protein
LIAAAESEQQDDDSEKPDETRVDSDKGAGKMIRTQAPQATSDEVWLRNLSLSPAGFLKQKFAIEDARKAAPAQGRQP